MDNNLRMDEGLVDRLLDTHYHAKGRALHGTHPRDLLNHVIHAALYLGKPVELNSELLELACETYFVDSDE